MASFYQSYLNPVRYWEEGIDDEYEQATSFHMDDFPFEQTILPWQQHTQFYQHWQFSDSINQQFTSGVPITLKVLDSDKNVIFTEPFVKKQQNYYEPDMFIYEHSLPLSIFDEGVYFLALKAGDLELISSPMVFAEKVESSLLLSYKNFEYFCSVVFETGFYPSLRIPAILRYKNPASKRTQYEDQPMNTKTLKSTPYRVWSLHVGLSTGIPDYFIDLISFAMECSSKALNSRLYTIQDGAKWEESEEEDYPMRGWTIELRDALNRGSRIFDDVLPVNQGHYIISVADSKGFGLSSGGNDIAIKDIE